IVVAWGALLKVAALVRLRVVHPGPRAFRVGINARIGTREQPLGLFLIAGVIAIPALLFLFTFAPTAIAATASLVTLPVLLGLARRLDPGGTPALSTDVG